MNSGHRRMSALMPIRTRMEVARAPLSDERKSDPEQCAAATPIFRRYLPIVCLDNGARDGQPHAHAFGLGGEKRFEDLF